MLFVFLTTTDPQFQGYIPASPFAQSHVVMEPFSNAMSASIVPICTDMLWAGPELVTTSTRLPSGFVKAAWLTPANLLSESKRRAPRRMAREK